MTVIITSFRCNWNWMNTSFWSIDAILETFVLLSMKKQFLWKNLHSSIEFFFFFKPSDLSFSPFFVWKFHFRIHTYKPDSSSVYSSTAGAHYFTILATPCRNWRNNFHQLRRRRQQCAATAAPLPPHRSVAASAWRSQQGEVTWVRPEKISSIPSTDYGHTMTKFLILSGQKSTPTPNYIFGIWI